MTKIDEKDIRNLFSLTYYISSSVSYLFSSFVSIVAIVLGRKVYSSVNKKLNEFGIISLRFSILFGSAILIFVGQLLTTIGILYVSYPVNFYMILFGRIIYGFADGMQESNLISN